MLFCSKHFLRVVVFNCCTSKNSIFQNFKTLTYRVVANHNSTKARNFSEYRINIYSTDRTKQINITIYSSTGTNLPLYTTVHKPKLNRKVTLTLLNFLFSPPKLEFWAVLFKHWLSSFNSELSKNSNNISVFSKKKF